MSVISLFSVSKSYGERIIFKDLTFSIMKGKKVALFGYNGSGKTTLFKIIAGIEEKDSGQIVISNDTKIGYLEQILVDDATIFDFMLRSNKRILELEEKIESCFEPEKIHRYYEEFELIGGNSFRSEIRELLKAFDFYEDVWDKNINLLSGGELERLKLARLLVSDANLLLLDEPTNYLDILMIDWLENFLKKSDKTVIFITHDRRLLENVAEEILYLNNKKIDHFRMKFNSFIKIYKEDEERLKIRKNNLEEEKQKLWDFVDRYRAGIKSKQVNARLKLIEKIEEELHNLTFDDRNIDFYFKKGKDEDFEVITFDNLVLGYGNRVLNKPFSAKIYKGEKVAVVGRNGSGKSSLLKLVVGNKSGLISGAIGIGKRVEMGYFEQILKTDSDKTVLEELLDLDIGITLQDIYNLLPKFGFSYEDIEKKVSLLSGGELAKINLMKLYFLRPNLLILDEPTNHLDYETVEVLKNALLNYDGTIIMVSHDRYFMDGLIDRYIFFNDGIVTLEDKIPVIKEVENDTTIKRATSVKNKNRKVDKYKINRINADILELENLLNSLYLEREKSITDWKKLAEYNAKIEEMELELLKKYDELEKLTQEDI
ncbi:ABC-F family ATP-binding cassette domain-containing protein [Calditerrivibrio nitroreducens]|uniref:ABC transporter related protein n=1 Tax=Calditerrivibrio nitroreducens (strain DSM 19672 / NBRC 101217 / Yu37-1) TaxID=768670 RepID=E4TEM7_CALNY|nr:ABC-F family ATP-binding cassette domain-containing protein [Calditerrivibrio nitroreducens]ADR19384.1 ABC transporter related protein [Calditerrivibrio nitroreducens DSM 19672]